LNLLGGSTENWKMQHNILHHTYTNVDKLDDDIQDRLILKFSPHSETKSFHQFQWIYAFFMYGLLTLYWAVAKDFVQYRQFILKGVNTAKKSKNRRWLLKLIGLKLFYFGYMIALPIVLGLPIWLVIAGFLLMHFVAGLVLTVTFQLAHSLEYTEHPLPDENGIIHCDWAIHQMQTTINFAPDNRFLSWYMGGLNYQVEHHLFPRISHVHYPAIAPIVRKTAEEFGVPYMVNKTMGEAIASHIRYLKELGKMPDLNEALG
jgi:linoleoyl-CoA desaturase